MSSEPRVERGQNERVPAVYEDLIKASEVIGEHGGVEVAVKALIEVAEGATPNSADRIRAAETLLNWGSRAPWFGNAPDPEPAA